MNATKEAWPGGTNRSALNTSAFTSPTRTNPTDRSDRHILPVDPRETAPRGHHDEDDHGGADQPEGREPHGGHHLVARAMMGQLNPKMRTVAAPTR